MPLVSSGGTQLIHRFTVSNGADLIDQISTILQACGWIATTVTDGFRFQGESPQGMQIFLYIRDLGHKLGVFQPNEITFNFQTVDFAITGIDHEIAIDPTWTYQIIACCCQFFLCVVGLEIDTSGSGSSLCGGIPWIPGATGPCSSQVITQALPTQAFWAMGDYVDGGSPRRWLIQGESPFGPDPMLQCEALWGTDYCAAGNAIGSVRIPVLTVAPQIFHALNRPSPILYHNDDYLTYEPMLVWGTDNTTLPFVRGQIFNAMITSKQCDMDSTRLVDGVPMINFTHAYLYGALHLIDTSFDAHAGNYAFIAT